VELFSGFGHSEELFADITVAQRLGSWKMVMPMVEWDCLVNGPSFREKSNLTMVTTGQ
jgi:hypothetical protein